MKLLDGLEIFLIQNVLKGQILPKMTAKIQMTQQ